jgi:Domain of unknown function (DUF4272)
MQRLASITRRGLVLVGLQALTAAAFAQSMTSDHQSRKRAIDARRQSLDPEALARKARSIATLQAAGIPHNPHMPVVETEAATKFRTAEAIAKRAIALCVVAAKGEGPRGGIDDALIQKLIKQFDVAADFTPKEAAFIATQTPSDKDRINFSWRYEAIHPLLWSIGLVEQLGPADRIVNVPATVALIRDNGRSGILARARLRSRSEILDQVDLIYRTHWAVVEARLNGVPAPAKHEPGVVLERHYALNWVASYMDQDWDNVSTDT